MKFGFIGTGNMAGALVRALRKNVAAESVYLSNRTADKARLLADEVGGNVTCNETIARQCQVIFLGVKPNLMQSVLQPLSPILKERTQDFVLVSMASGISMADIQKMAAGNYPVMRIMPNTPAAIGEGLSLIHI